jgi:transcriptional regulator with XRE-family HTH domain
VGSVYLSAWVFANTNKNALLFSEFETDPKLSCEVSESGVVLTDFLWIDGPVLPPFPSPASSSRLKAERERLSLTVRDVARMSRNIANQRNSNEYYIAHSSLADIEHGRQLPSIYKLYSLAVIYKRRYDEIASWCGVPIADADKEHRTLAFPRTYLIGRPPEEARQVILTASDLRKKLLSEQTNILPQILARWSEQSPRTLLHYFDRGEELYGYIGVQDKTLSPIVRPGSFVQINPKEKAILSLPWCDEHDRPIYFFELRDSYVCSWCELHDNDLILVPSRESGRHARHIRYPNDVTIVGRVTAISMRLVEVA